MENVLYDAQLARVKLIDFGFAIVLTPTSSKLNVFCGTPTYMAPEIINKKEYSFPVDIWALGILLFKSLNGNYPFRGNHESSLLLKHFTQLISLIGLTDKDLFSKINCG